MITLASELLSCFVENEKKNLQNVFMPHMPTLGSAYEEITKQGIDQSFVIPKNLDLRVVAGFIEIGDELLPEQIDCMLVVGSGRRYGLTDQYIYGIECILCIFEVKKTLTKKDYFDAFDHLGKIRKKFAEYFETKLRSGFQPDITEPRKHFSQITGKIAPETYSDIHYLPKTDAILFYTLVQEKYAPVSIIHGYGGYKTELGLRNVFIDLIEEKSKINGQGLGVPSLPTLVTSNNFCIIKGNGYPYIAIKDDSKWVAMFSTRHNPFKIILELIWSKISIYYGAKMPWGLDLDVENIQPLLLANPIEKEGIIGWLYENLNYSEKQMIRDESSSWTPEKISSAEMSVINVMAMQGEVELSDDLAKYILKTHSRTLDSVAKDLIKTRAFAMDGNYLKPLASLTLILTNDDDSGYLALDRNRFDSWCKNNNIKPQYLNLIQLQSFL